MREDVIEEEQAMSPCPPEDGREPVDDLGDALTLTRNGRAKITENNRGHG